jgi:hypothetical protein
VLGPADLNLAEGTSTIVYAWGSAEDENLDLAVQTIDGLGAEPNGVPAGEAGLADSSSTAGLWILALAVALFAATAAVLVRRRTTTGARH